MKNELRYITVIFICVLMFFSPLCSFAAESDELLNDAGLVYYYRGQYLQALDNFLKASEVNPKNPEVYFNMGRSYNKLRKPLEAMKALQKALDLKPNYGVAKTVLKKVEAELAQKDRSSVQTFSRNYRIMMPAEISYPYPDFTEGFYAYYDCDLQGSIDKFERDMKKPGKAVQAIMDQAVIKYHTGYFGEAINYFKNAAGADPGNASAWFDLGLSYEQAGRSEDAIDSYEKAARSDPKLTDAAERLTMIKDNLLMNQINAAGSYFKKAQWEKAITLYEKAREIALPHSTQYNLIVSRINVARIELERTKERQKEINQAFLSRNIDFADASRYPARYIGSLVTWSGELHDVERYGQTTDLIMYRLPGAAMSSNERRREGDKNDIFIIRLNRPFPKDFKLYSVCDMTVVGRITAAERLRNAFKYGDYNEKIIIKPLKITVFER